MKLKDITNVFGSKKNDQLKIRSKKDKSIKRKLTSSMNKKLNRMSGIICDPAKTIGLETELKLSPAITVHYTSKIIDVAKVMSVKDNTTCVLVIDDRGQLCGILTDKDIVFRVLATGMDPKRTAVHTVMTMNPVTATLETAKKVAMQAIYTGAFWHIPIISDNDSSTVVKTNVIGMINLNELFGRDIIEKLQQTPSFIESSLPSTSDNSFAYSDIDMISRYEEIRQQKLTVVLDQHEQSPPEIDGKMNVSIASNIMKIYKKGAVIVCDTDSRSLLGILTTQDLILRVVATGRLPSSTSVKSVMTPNPPVVNPNKQVSKTLQYMLDNNYKYIVIGADLKITGIVDILEVTRAALQQLQERDEIEEDARSRRSFSEDGSYYDSSRLMQRSSRSTLQSLEDNDKHAKNENLLNSLDDSNDEDNSDEVRPTFLPRDVSLINNNLITETIPELDEDKISEFNQTENNTDNGNEIVDDNVVVNSNKQNIESVESHSIDNNSDIVSQSSDDIPMMTMENKTQSQTNNISLEQSSNENLTNDMEIKVKEIVLPNEIESNINEIIEQNDIETSINESLLPNETNPNEIMVSNEITNDGHFVENNGNEYVDSNIIENNDSVETTEQKEFISENTDNETSKEIEILEKNIEIENIEPKELYENINDNGSIPEDVIQINNQNINNVNNVEKINENNNNSEFDEIEITYNNDNNNNTNENAKKSVQPEPEIVISNEFDNQYSPDVINPINNELMSTIEYQNIPQQLEMIEASVNNYHNQVNKASSTLFNNKNQNRSNNGIATIDAVLAVEVNDEGIHNLDVNKTFQDMDNFLVTNNNKDIRIEDLQGSGDYYNELTNSNNTSNIYNYNNTLNGSEQEVSDEAKKFVNNIIGANVVPEINEIISETENINPIEMNIFNNDVYTDNNNVNNSNNNTDNEELENNINNEPLFNDNVLDQNKINNENASLEFPNINIQYVDDNNKLIDEVPRDININANYNGNIPINSNDNYDSNFNSNDNKIIIDNGNGNDNDNDNSEMENINENVSDNNDNENKVYDLSTIMPSSPPMPMENFNYQDGIIPSLNLNQSIERNESFSINNGSINDTYYSMKSHEINNRSSITLQDGFTMGPNTNDISSIHSNEYLYRKRNYNPIITEEIEENLSTTLPPTQEREDDETAIATSSTNNNNNNQDDAKSAVMETIALDSDSNIVLDRNHNQNQEETVIERGNLIGFDKTEEQKNNIPPKSVLEYIRQIVTPNVISHIFKYSLDKSPLDDSITLNSNGENSTTMLVKRVVGGRDLYDEEERRYNDQEDSSSSTALYPSQYLNTSQKRISSSRLAATHSIIKEEDLLLKCFDQETEQVYRINYNNDTRYLDIVNTILKKSKIENRENLLFGYLDEDRDFITIESEEDFLQGIWLARKLLWGRLLIVIKHKNKSYLKSILPWGHRSATSNANNDQGSWLNNAMLIGVGIAATLAVKRISS
ncbi:hypothetical protein LY90DRAFT_664838 [Neocallimastix californiae]|jgi:CBS domain-containing protein|uniref:CBS domain-containing protein n=1 Tax=Neocallimastix californiae TaxID=1754190 RepID=A0A1Y2F8I5_9FUNG|nr:hypothetical protein LY90DRAFT_664838 [Neocallimastix californiae]|eukprot:ORY79225.1 hypothetical protein LY90DRAFT_664838 [Neocallimastix californiae]